MGAGRLTTDMLEGDEDICETLRRRDRPGLVIRRSARPRGTNRAHPRTLSSMSVTVVPSSRYASRWTDFCGAHGAFFFMVRRARREAMHTPSIRSRFLTFRYAFFGTREARITTSMRHARLASLHTPSGPSRRDQRASLATVPETRRQSSAALQRVVLSVRNSSAVVISPPVARRRAISSPSESRARAFSALSPARRTRSRQCVSRCTGAR